MKHYRQGLTIAARQLRQQMTSAETLLWARLRRHALNGLKFTRQRRVGHYIVDFYCGELKLIIELE